jgi:molybdopterin-guanine dinucleotide biosynthesis protein A
MGGADKALLTIGGEPLLERLITRLARQCVGLAVNANGDPERFASFGFPVVADDVPDFAGPLAGVLAGLDYVAVAAPGVSHVVTVPADTPFIPLDLVERLAVARAATGAEIAVASSSGRVHHAIALWPLALRFDLRRALVEEDVRAVSAFISRHRHALAPWRVDPYDPFFNVNRPDDLARAEEIAARVDQT